MPDTPARPTLLQRVVLWILGALLFYIVALYPNFLMAGFQPDDVVHYGFLKWLAVVFVLYWIASQLFFTERPADTRPGRQTLAVTAAILLLFGIFSPIVSFSFVGDVDFFRSGYGDGYILLVMTAASLALAVTGRWKQVIVPALGGLAVILWTFLGVQETISDARSGGSPELAGNPHAGLAPATMASIQWEWGWILLFAGSGLLVYSAARRDEMADAAPPFAAVPVDDESEAAPAETATEAAPGAPVEPTPVEPAEPAEGDGEPATSAAQPAAEAEREQPATAESAAAEEPATTAADETPAPEPATAADETAPAEAADPATAETQAPATGPEAAEAPAPEADVAAADANAQAESEATPAASATGEAESAVAGPAPAEAEANDAAGEAEPASESAASDAQESEGASSASDQAAAEASQPAPGETAAGGERGESDSKAASDTKNE